MPSSNTRLGLFFDGANHADAIRLTNAKMDYKKVLKLFQSNYESVVARYYTGISEKKEHENVKAFIKNLGKCGYVIIQKPIREFPDGTIKANLDVELACDMLTMAPRLDAVVLFSGDGDFTYLVNEVQKMGVKVTVCGHGPMTSVDLKNQCDEFLEIQDLLDIQNH